jgi:hypothetical protein
MEQKGQKMSRNQEIQPLVPKLKGDSLSNRNQDHEIMGLHFNIGLKSAYGSISKNLQPSSNTHTIIS